MTSSVPIEEEKKEEEPKIRVLIVGAGLAGLSAALSLIHKNNAMQVTIVESRPDFKSRGATFGMNPLAQKALSELASSPDLVEQLKEEGVLLPTGGYMLPWGLVRDKLLEDVEKNSDKITINLGVSIESVVERDENDSCSPPLVATFKNSDLRINADVLIGADGVHSFVRTNILKAPPPIPSRAHVWRGSIDTKAMPEVLDYPVAKFVSFRGAILLSYFNFHPKVDGATAWVFSTKTDKLPDNCRDIKPGITRPQDLLKTFMASVEDPDDELLENYQTAMRAFENPTRPEDLTWSSEMKVVDLNTRDNVEWGGKGRITLIGDAAHAVRPASGLGGGLAFEDSALLGRYLEKCGAKNDIECQLRAFENHRLPRCKSISNDQSLRSELSYKVGFYKIPQWDPKYQQWVDDGFDATPEPPVSETEVFGDLLKEL